MQALSMGYLGRVYRLAECKKEMDTGTQSFLRELLKKTNFYE